MPRPISLTISRTAMRHNLDVVMQSLAQSSPKQNCSVPKVWAVIKANAYGHGIEHAVASFSRADGLAMLDLAEAVQVRHLGYTKPVLMLEGFFDSADLPVFADLQLTAVIHNVEQLRMLEQSSSTSALCVYLKFNAGMNRLGFKQADFLPAWERAHALQSSGKIHTLGKMMHFSSADSDLDASHQELDVFLKTTQTLPGPVSISNSAATFTPSLWGRIKMQEQWVRPGVCLYGGSPFVQRRAKSLGLQPAQTFRSRILGVQHLQAGEFVGYGRTFIANKPMRMAVVACGYADGYLRGLSHQVPVCVGGEASHILGRISMDMLAVDVSHIPQAGPGTEVVLWGEGGPDIDVVAAHAQTIGYELMCGVAARVPRIII